MHPALKLIASKYQIVHLIKKEGAKGGTYITWPTGYAFEDICGSFFTGELFSRVMTNDFLFVTENRVPPREPCAISRLL